MDAIWDAFFSGKSCSSWRPSAELEHIKGTYDWNRWLKRAFEEDNQQPPSSGGDDQLCIAGWRKEVPR
jgi:hypothetical protein